MLLLQSRLGIGRLNAFRLGWFQPFAFVTIGGVTRTTNVRLGTVQIVDNSRSTPSTASMRVSGFVPAVGNPVSVAIGASDRLIFSGFIVGVQKVIEGGNATAAANIAYDITCQDQNWFLNRRDVFARYTNVDAAVAVTDIITRFAPGFTTNHVFSGIGTITDKTFAGETVAEAISAIAALFGSVNCQWYVDYNSDIHFYVTDTVTNPATVTVANTLSFLDETDLSQVRTRVYGKGASNPTSFAAAVGATTLSVADTSIFSASGGSLLTPDGQIVTYTGKAALAAPAAPTAAIRTGGRATISSITRSGSTATVTTSAPHGYSTGDLPTVSGANQPEYNGTFAITVTGSTTFTYTVTGTPATPATGTLSAFLEIGGLLSIGEYDYRTTLISESGETLGSVGSTPVSVTAVTAPTAPTAAVRTGGRTVISSITRSGSTATVTTSTAHGYSTGDQPTIAGATQTEYNGAFTITVTGTTTFTYTVSGTPATPATGTLTAYLDISGTLTPGAYGYGVSFLTSQGETLVGTTASATVTAIATPGAPSVATRTGGLVSISSITRSSSTATVTTAAAHGYSTGDTPTIAGAAQPEYNGTYSITVTGTTTFTYTVTGTPATPATGTLTAYLDISGALAPGAYGYGVSFLTSQGETLVGTTASASVTSISAPGAPTAAVRTGGLVSISSITRSSSTATVTTSVAHGYSTGDQPTIAGAAQTEYNGTFAITVTGTTTFTYTVSGTPATPATGTKTAFLDISGGLTVGVYGYRVAYVTSHGETLGGTTATATVTAIATGGPGSPAPTSGATGNLGVGSYQYQQTFVTRTGETLVGNAVTGTVTAVATAAPSGASPTSGATGTLRTGSYGYKQTYTTRSGETLVGTNVTGTVTAISTPGAPSVAAASSTGNLTQGSFGYLVTYVTPSGETTAGSTASQSIASVGNPSCSITDTTGGSMALGTYYYKINYVTASGENGTGTSTNVVTVQAGHNAVSLTSISTGGSRVTQRKIYRTTVGGFSGGPFYLVATINDNTTTSYTDTTADASLGVAMATTDTASTGQMSLTSIPTSGDARVTSRRIYRTAVGGSVYKLLTTLSDNTTTTYTDNTADASLGVNVPTVDTASTGTITVTLAVSADARVTGRTLYRTAVGGSTYYKVASINDNSTTSLVDNLADASLTTAVPLVDTASTATMTLTLATSTDKRVTGRRLYRTLVGGSVTYLIASVGDNTTTTYVDNTPDANLVTSTPSTDTASTAQVRITALPTSADPRVTQRKIYRTTVGGTAYALVATLGDNTTTFWIDNVPDVNLTTPAPTIDTASSGQMRLTSLPVSSDARVIGRVLYRTSVGGTIYQRLATLSDNTTTSYLDNTPDTSLGTWASTIDTSGGSQMRVTNIATSTDPRVTGRKLYRTRANGTDWYLVTTITDNTTTSFIDNIADADLPLTRTPAASTIVGLTGIPASGAGSITAAIPAGTNVRLFTQRDDLAAQAALALLEGGDGIHEHPIDDDTVTSLAALNAICDADLATFGSYEPKVSYDTRDPYTVGGSAITVSMAAPVSVSGAYTGQSVTITEIGIATSTPWVFPRRSVNAARTRFTLDDILRRVELR